MVYNFCYFCSLYNSLHTRGAVQNVVNNNNTTGTAVTTMNDCKAFTLPSPIETKTITTRHTRGAVQNRVNNNTPPGTAVTTMNDCKAFTLPSPRETKTIATNPITSA